MKKDKLKEKSNKDLQLELEKRRKNLRVLRFNLAVNRLKNHGDIKKEKKEIARILTFINKKK